MLLERLAEYGRRIAEEEGEERLPPMYQRVPIRYIIKLDREGKLLGIISTETEEQQSGKEFIAPYRGRANKIKPRLFADHAEYTLNIPRRANMEADDKLKRVSLAHAAYIDMVSRCAEETKEPSVEAAHRFLSTLTTSSIGLPSTHQRADDPAMANITFDVDGVYPFQLPSVQVFWAREASATDPDSESMQCLVCGEIKPAAERLAIAIVGVPGGRHSKALISANADAFESYGLKASLIAPTCEECGLLFGNALNHLLQAKDTHLSIEEIAYIFWTREPVATGWGTLLSDAKPDDVRSFLASFWRSEPSAAQLDTVSFYAATLSASVSRVVVRDWLETTLGSAKRHLRRYFQMQRLKDISGEERYFPLWQVLAATKNAHSRREEVAPQVGQALMRTALHGDRLPDWLLYQAVRRTRAEQQVLPSHAALIKMVLLSQEIRGDEELNERNDMSALDRTRPEPAYHCGRLFAELEAIQRRALGDISQTIADRFYGTASSAPASVFARLIRGAQPHLSKMRRDEKWMYERFERRLEEINSHIGDFPRTLTLRHQGLFALGYYHQRAADAEEIRQAVERNRQKALAATNAQMERPASE